MAAAKTVYQPLRFHNSPVPRNGVFVLSGYGIRVQVNAGHLALHDGIADERRTIRLPRVGHGLHRLVMIGSDGFITLEALRWLADQDVAFVMLERNGKVICVTGPVRSSDARLRRAQALAGQSMVGIQIARELIDKKLAGQEKVARYKLLAEDNADMICRYREELPSADTLERIRLIESRAAAVYWSLWRNLPVAFPKKDESRIPTHWRSFGARMSPLTGSPRVAVNPQNAMLNYLYSVLASESRLAAATLGLDPGLGFLHLDIASRDSLACDLMEAVRPQVDAYLLDWITRDPLKREWFSERPDGNCRLIASLAAHLSETAPLWGRAVAPVAEWLAQTLWTSARGKSVGNQVFPTRLTQSRKRLAQGGTAQSVSTRLPHREIFVGNAEKRFSAGTPVVEIAELRPLPDVCRRLLESDASRHTALKHKQSGAILNAAMPYCGIPGRHQANRPGSLNSFILRKSARSSHKCRAPLLRERLG